VCDQLRANIIEATKHAIKERNTQVAVIPGSLTSQQQSLKILINKPLKVNNEPNGWRQETMI
jgi:hypothetical protein